VRPVTALRLRALDAVDVLRGRRDPLLPPRRLRGTVGDTDFAATGESIVRLLVERAGLRPGHRVLDVGCGIGRVARPLTGVLAPEGEYEGFDASRQAVRWCARRYRRRHPRFRFRHLDVHNAAYNPRGSLPAREVDFPYEDASFDVVLAASVLTHLLTDAADRYLGEMARVLRPGGRTLITFFLLDGEARALQRAGRGKVRLLREHWPACTARDGVPEEAVGYDESWVRERHDAHGLEVLEPILRGSWCGRSGAAGFQDVVVAQRRLTGRAG
jgi:SAM-dependent methyltransferase